MEWRRRVASHRLVLANRDDGDISSEAVCAQAQGRASPLDCNVKRRLVCGDDGRSQLFVIGRKIC